MAGLGELLGGDSEADIMEGSSTIAGSERERASAVADESRSDSSVEMMCVGCDISSKANDPVCKKKSSARVSKVKWGKETTRTVKKKGPDGTAVKIKRKVRCGSWCNMCARNIERWIKNKRFSGVFKKSGKREVVKKIKDDLRTDRDFKKRWKGNIDEAVHLMAGGRSRIAALPERVDVVEESFTDITDNSFKFYTTKRYKEVFGMDPKRAKAKIVNVTLKNGQRVAGVYVRSKPEGEYDVSFVHRNSVKKSKAAHDGQEVLDENEITEAHEAALAENGTDVAGALSLEETQNRIQEIEKAEAAIKSDDGGDASDASGSDSDSGSEASSCGSEDGGGVGAASASESEKAPRRKRPRTNSSSAAGATSASVASTPLSKVSKQSGKQTAGVSSAEQSMADSTVDDIEKILSAYTEGQYDSHKGRLLQVLHREWNDMIMSARKLLKRNISGTDKQKVQNAIEKLTRVSSFMKLCAKTNPLYLELATGYDKLDPVNVVAPASATNLLTMKHIEHLLAHSKANEAISLLRLDAAAGRLHRHGLRAVEEGSSRDDACKELICKIVAYANRVPTSGITPEHEAQSWETLRQLADASCAGWPADVARHVKFIGVCANGIGSAGREAIEAFVEESKSVMLGSDGRKPPSSVLAAFCTSRLGKGAAKAAASAMEQRLKDTVGQADFERAANSITPTSELLAMKEAVQAMVNAAGAMHDVAKVRACCVVPTSFLFLVQTTRPPQHAKVQAPMEDAVKKITCWAKSQIETLATSWCGHVAFQDGEGKSRRPMVADLETCNKLAKDLSNLASYWASLYMDIFQKLAHKKVYNALPDGVVDYRPLADSALIVNEMSDTNMEKLEGEAAVALLRRVARAMKDGHFGAMTKTPRHAAQPTSQATMAPMCPKEAVRVAALTLSRHPSLGAFALRVCA